jgi:hypothetical protein
MRILLPCKNAILTPIATYAKAGGAALAAVRVIFDDECGQSP